MHTTHKSRNIARSALSSTARHRVRRLKRLVHHRERARIRAMLHEVRTYPDPDDFDGDLGWRNLEGLDDVIGLRHCTDKLAPLMRWAETTLDRTPELDGATAHDRVEHFARLLPDDLSGRHAVGHLRWMLGEPDWFLDLPLAEHPKPPEPLCEEVAAILAAGLHGELNDCIRRARRMQAVDDCAPGRYLEGAHDVGAFSAAIATDQVVCAVVADRRPGLTRRRSVALSWSTPV